MGPWPGSVEGAQVPGSPLGERVRVPALGLARQVPVWRFSISLPSTKAKAQALGRRMPQPTVTGGKRSSTGSMDSIGFCCGARAMPHSAGQPRGSCAAP